MGLASYPHNNEKRITKAVDDSVVLVLLQIRNPRFITSKRIQYKLNTGHIACNNLLLLYIDEILTDNFQ